MKFNRPLGAALLIGAWMLNAQPASAQYANEFSLAKVITKGTTSQPIAGSGEVTVQVQVNADGTHKAIKVIKTTNSGDNAAAMDIAQNSTYKPAHKGTTPVTSFYDFTLKFNGKSVSTDVSASDTTAQQVDALVRAGHYDDAIAKANAGLASSPNDAELTQLLGVAQYYNKDSLTAAQTFEKVTTINKTFQPVAASAYAEAAVKVSTSDPAQSLAFAQKGTSLQPDSPNNQFALGVAQLSNGKYADAITTLKPLPAKVSDKSVKLAIDRQLLSAYLGNNDSSGADSVAAEMKALDPSGTEAQAAIGAHYLTQGNAAMQAKDYKEALKAYDQAAAAGDPKVAVTASLGAAFALLQQDKPDYDQAKDRALKAVAGDPDNAQANYAAGMSFDGIYSTVSHAAADKEKALDYLKKADDEAKAAGNTSLSAQIESQIKQIQ
jgi:tetratricopeptide (TPR) repeat protein